jgi:hypothetical protein
MGKIEGQLAWVIGWFQEGLAMATIPESHLIRFPAYISGDEFPQCAATRDKSASILPVSQAGGSGTLVDGQGLS